MLAHAAFIARKDLHYMLRAKETLLWVFFMPIVFFYFIGTVTRGFGPSGDGKDRLVLAAGENPGFLADQLAQRLADRDYEVVRRDGIPAAGVASEEPHASGEAQLILPAHFTDRVLGAETCTVRLVQSETGPAADYHKVRAGRAVYTLLADLAVAAELGSDPTPESLARLNETPRALRLDVHPAGERRRIATGFEQTIPGTLVMFVLLVMTTSGAVLLVVERRQGLLRRLASSPMSRGSIVAGKWAGKWTLGLVQIAFAMAAGTVLFDMEWGSLHGVLVVLAAYAAFMASVGLLLGTLAQTEGQAVAIGVISANVLAALGGCWWPIEVTPEWMQRLALFLPTGWAMDALHQLISFGASPATILPHVLGMLLGANLACAAAARFFRFH